MSMKTTLEATAYAVYYEGDLVGNLYQTEEGMWMATRMDHRGVEVDLDGEFKSMIEARDAVERFLE